MVGTDRYIVNRNSYDDFTSYFLLSQSQKRQESSDQEMLSYREMKNRKHMSYLLHGYEIENMKVLDHTNKPRQTRLKDLKAKDKIPRKVKVKPERVLEAPGIVNDYYTFSIDWGHHNTLAVALENCVYTWNTDINKTLLVAEYPHINNRYVSCVLWKPKTELLAVTNTNPETIDILADTFVIQTLRNNLNHQIISMSWNDNLLSCGSIDGIILHFDTRTSCDQPCAKTQEEDTVCGLAWSPNLNYLASGSNNMVKVWDFRKLESSCPVVKNECHNSAVKAIAWCPWDSSLLASGGGKEDRNLIIWNSMNGKEKMRVDTGSQITSVVWSEQYRELLTSHGTPDNSLKLWKYPSLDLIEELSLHQLRILSAVQSPDNSCVAAISVDETISIWNCFPRDKKNKGAMRKNVNEDRRSLEFALYNTIR